MAVTELGKRDYLTIVRRAVRAAVDDDITDAAAAIAYYAFLAIPALLLISVGFFSIFASAAAVETIIEKLGAVMPEEAVALLETGLQRTTEEGGGLTMILIGGAVALGTASGAANAVMRALNRVHDTEETRGFVRQRLVGLAMVGVAVVAFAIVFGLLILGPKLSGWVGELVGAEAAVRWGWLLGQWPILIVGLLVTFGAVLFLGPNIERPRWRFLTIGAGLAIALCSPPPVVSRSTSPSSAPTTRPGDRWPPSSSCSPGYGSARSPYSSPPKSTPRRNAHEQPGSGSHGARRSPRGRPRWSGCGGNSQSRDRSRSANWWRRPSSSMTSTRPARSSGWAPSERVAGGGEPSWLLTTRCWTLPRCRSTP